VVLKGFYGWHVVTACFVIAAFAWGLGLFGSSVYLQAVTAAHDWSIAQVSSAITLFFLISASIQRPVGRSIATHGPRPVLLIGAVSMTVAVAMIGRVDRPWQLYPCFALLGVGWATLSTTGISATVAPWFERHQGRSITLAIMGASFGAIVGVPLLLYVIRRLGLDGGLSAIACVAAAVLLPLIAIVLRYRGPAELGLKRDGMAAGAGESGAPATHIATEANRRRLLWSSTLAFSLALTMQIGFIAHHVALAQPVLGTVGAGMLVSATGVVALIGRLYLARIVDVSSVRRLASQAMLAQLVAMLAIGISASAPVLIVASLAYGFAIGHVTTLSPIVVRREFGAENFGAAYGGAATVIQFTSAFGPALIGYLRDMLGSYQPVLLISAAVTALACASIHLGRERRV
jgi:MFS family permease